MADYRLNLSDGTTTIDLYDGNIQVLEGGLATPPPAPRPTFVSNPYFDGGRLTSFHYENREISVNLKITGSSLAGLKTYIRDIHRLLNDAVKREVLGYGDAVYLEYQWGDVADESTFFDVLRGDLVLPKNYLSALLSSGYQVLNATLRLTCKPFGRYTNQDIGMTFPENRKEEFGDGVVYGVNDNAIHSFSGVDWEGQTFTTIGGFTAVAAMLKIERAGACGNVTCELYATAAGVPNGAPIATKTIDVDDPLWQGAGNDGDWLRFEFDTPVALSGATMYAVVLNLAGAIDLHWRADNAAGGPAGGTRVWSANSGGAWNIDATDDFMFDIMAASTEENWQDVTTAEAHGDVPARLFIKVQPTNGVGSKKMWIAKRSGSRQTDNLWIHGEDYGSFTTIYAFGGNEIITRVYSPAQVNQVYSNAEYNPPGGVVPIDEELGRWNFTLPTMPKGLFRVLARVLNTQDDPNDFDHIGYGFGWVYGDRSKTPSAVNGDYYTPAVDATWEVIDLGVLILPPIPESDIATNNTLELRIYNYTLNGVLTNGEEYNCQLDYIFLLPIDEGVVIIEEVSISDDLALDGITDPERVFVTTGATVILDYPDYVGKPFTLGRESTRLYFLRDDLGTEANRSVVTYQPQFLVI